MNTLKKKSQISVLDLTRNPKPMWEKLKNRFPGSSFNKISKNDWKKKGSIGLLKAARQVRSHWFIIAVDDLDAINDEMLFTILGLLTRVDKFAFVGNRQDSIKIVTRLNFLFFLFPKFIFSLVGALLLVGGFFLFNILLRFVLWLRKDKIKGCYGIDPNFNRVAYLKTSFALFLEAGGSVTHTRGVIKGFKSNNKEILVLSNEDANWLKFDDIKVIPFPRTRRLSLFRETEYIINSIAFALRAIPVLQQYKPDVIYQRMCEFDLSGILLSFFLKIPLVIECNSSKVKGTYWDKFRFSRLCSAIERNQMIGSSVIVTISEQMRDVLYELGYPKNRILVNYNGVNENEFDTTEQRNEARRVREKFDIGPDKIIAGFVGTFGEWHGIPTLVESIVEVTKKNNDIFFVLIGDGRLKQFAEDAINKGDSKKQVIFTGIVKPWEVGAYLASCDLLLSPHSKSPDGQKFFGSPTKLFEYMASRKPIIASDLDQIGKILDHDQTAVLVEPNNPQALTKAIFRMSKDADLRKKVADNARECVIKKYTWEHNVKKVIEFLNRTPGIKNI